MFFASAFLRFMYKRKPGVFVYKYVGFYYQSETKNGHDIFDVSTRWLKYGIHSDTIRKNVGGINMSSFEPKKLALIRILQILQKHSDFNHPLTHEDIGMMLENEYGIIIERKAVGRNLSLLKEAGFDIESKRNGSYLESRDFDDAELRMLIDGVLSSKYITANHSKDLIERLCGLSNRYFRSHIKNIYSVNDWSKTDNQALFLNIELVDEAIEQVRQIHYDYNKYGLDKKLHKSSYQRVSPYQLILHNQRYYLMGYSDYWGNMVFHRLDRITNMQISSKSATDIRTIPGYESGIDYKKIASTMPYMYSDKPERVEFLADAGIVDQIIDWFGTDIRIQKTDNDQKVMITLTASPSAMFHWAMQYSECVEVVYPIQLRENILNALQQAISKYKL